MIERLLLIIVMFVFSFMVPFNVDTSMKKENLAAVEGLIEQEDYEQALVMLERMYGTSPVVHKESDYYYGVCYNRLGLYQLAASYIDVYTANDDNAKGRFEQAIAAFGMGDYEAACRGFEAVGAEYAEDEDYLYYYGSACYYAEEYEKAMDLLEQTIEYQMDKGYLFFFLYECYYATEEYDRGIQQINKDIGLLNPEDQYYELDREELIYYRADFYYLNGQYPEALAEYEVFKNPETYYHDEVYYLIARCYAQMGDLELTYRSLESGITFDRFYYYSMYKYDEAFDEFFLDPEYSAMMELLEDEYEEY